MLSVALAALPAGERAGYPERLEEFARVRRDRLAHLYREFSPDSAITRHVRYELVSHPVGIVLCERLDTKPMWLSGTWEGKLPDQWLADVAEAWGVPLALGGTPLVAGPVRSRTGPSPRAVRTAAVPPDRCSCATSGARAVRGARGR